MTLNQGRSCVCALSGCVLAVAMAVPRVMAQAPEGRMAPETTETIYLTNATGQNDMNDVQTALRNNFPRAHIYGVVGPYAITVRATTEDLAGMKKMVSELDRPRKVYRVTYTVYDVENGKRTGAQHYSLTVGSGSKAILKQGKRVPLVTGMTGEGTTAAQSSQVQYIDAGLNIEANVEGVALHTKLELSAIADEKSGIGAQDPVIQQTMLEGVSTLAAGKPVMLGSIDIPGTTRHQDIEVTTEVLGQ